ncbi:MAG TPA: molybdopterin-dependent oxidoreductase [Candidatus Limnocylindrales bacterium]|jgi:DMSO/TMAO reductase YedYZ molybdopterin-dependent catalytic subunit
MAGALAAGVAIAVTELVAGLLRGAPSLVTAIGTLVISLQPPGAKDVIVELFGTNDKLALNLGIVVVALAVAAIAGVLAARRFWLGAGVFIAFGVIALVAGLRQPLVDPVLAVANAVLAVAAGLVALRYLLRLGPPAPATDPKPARPGAVAAMPDWDRRRFLIASAGTLGGVVVVGRVGRMLVEGQHPTGVVSTNRLPAALEIVPPLTADQSIAAPGVSPLVVPNDQFYRIDTALLVPQVDATTWQLSVTGMVDHPLAFSYDELLSMPLFEQYVTIACVSNRVGGDLVGNALWTGVRLKDVLAMAGVQSGATQIVGRSVDGFTVGFPTSWAMAPEREPMIALGMNRDLLPADHGFPARLIIPGLYGYVSATKWLGEIELTTREAVDGYWVPLGWAKDAPILTQSRIDTPASGSQLGVGPIDIAGVAWAPDRGVSAVQVRIDDGAWQAATLARPISDATWVQWRLPWTSTSGQHSIEVQATDGTGAVQTAEQTDPAPDGARGHHRISVTVS